MILAGFRRREKIKKIKSEANHNAFSSKRIPGIKDGASDGGIPSKPLGSGVLVHKNRLGKIAIANDGTTIRTVDVKGYFEARAGHVAEVGRTARRLHVHRQVLPLAGADGMREDGLPSPRLNGGSYTVYRNADMEMRRNVFGRGHTYGPVPGSCRAAADDIREDTGAPPQSVKAQDRAIPGGDM